MIRDVDDAIKFYSQASEYHELSNFSPHGFSIDGAFWPTVEHFFQAQKFPAHPAHQAAIQAAVGPTQAKTLGSSRDVPIRDDWERVKEEIMLVALRAKFRTHADLRALLLSTGDRWLVEDSPTDSYWGCGRAGTGRNRLGMLLMQVREEIRSSCLGPQE